MPCDCSWCVAVEIRCHLEHHHGMGDVQAKVFLASALGLPVGAFDRTIGDERFCGPYEPVLQMLRGPHAYALCKAMIARQQS